MGLIKTFDYKEDELDKIKNYEYGLNWPVVYIIRNDKEAYVGESTRVYNRSIQHRKNTERTKLDTIDIIADTDFNKSATLNIESLLIEYMSADAKYKLQNGNGGLSNHSYYKKDFYNEKFDKIWDELKEKNIVTRGLFEIRNSDLFKYSPYKALTAEQSLVADDIISSIIHNTQSKHMIQGEPGTGKTIVAIYLLKYLKELEETKHLKIGLVIPMTSLRSTLSNVFKSVKNLKSNMVLSPSDATKNDYDILIVDEAHRLNRRVNITAMGAFDNTNRKLGLDINEGTQLDWINMSCKHMILCYDKNQSIKPSDVRAEDFEKIKFEMHKITSQMRVLGGGDYINYIQNILRQTQEEKLTFNNYELLLFDNISEMHEMIKLKNEKLGLCRLIAGYAWDWKSKKDKNAYDITIQDTNLQWNSTNKDWINTPNAINEVGCIHTTQGYDLNYTGIIIGHEISYKDDQLIVNKSKYFDTTGKNSIKVESELHNYIINIYKTILTRGIKGTYIYICDENLRNYFKQFIDTYISDVQAKEILDSLKEIEYK